jgi:hypothetical protein
MVLPLSVVLVPLQTLFHSWVQTLSSVLQHLVLLLDNNKED